MFSVRIKVKSSIFFSSIDDVTHMKLTHTIVRSWVRTH